ncbi:hypothetical protein ACLKA6_012720 [Drosophila palustris]
MAMDVSRATLATASSKQHGKGDQQSNQKAVMPTSTDAPHKMEQKGRFKCKGKGFSALDANYKGMKLLNEPLSSDFGGVDGLTCPGT